MFHFPSTRLLRRSLFCSALLPFTMLAQEAQPADTLTAIPAGQPAPQNTQELWEGFDPQAEPLDTEVLHEWEEDGVIIQVVRYRVGIFKGKKSMVAGFFGYPKDATPEQKIPGLIHIHGGGQYADSNVVFTNAKRGYATLSISWAGRLASPTYRVSPHEVKLFWDNKTEDPNYKLTTDWGALDGYHAPSRNGKDAFVALPVEDWTIDAVKSPRNSSWFLGTMATRRGLTFLERQPQIDANRLGVYGHSMGGKLTVLTSFDPRVKAAAPSCGGISDYDKAEPLHQRTVGDRANLPNITCPIFFLKPANDFHSRIQDLPLAIHHIKSKEWRIASTPHLNHQDHAPSSVATQLWFDEHLKGTFKTPTNPHGVHNLDHPDGTPTYSVTPDASQKILGVEVYYSQHLTGAEHHADRNNAKIRHWHHAKPTQEGNTYTAKLPLTSTDKALWVYANVIYDLAEPITGAGYYHNNYTAETFNLSSIIQCIPAAQLQAAKTKATLAGGTLIENFQDGWEKEWFQYRKNLWGLTTHRVGHPIWKAPENAQLSLTLLAKEGNTLVIGLDSHVAEVAIKGSPQPQTITLSPADFKDANEEALATFQGIAELRYADTETLRGKDKKTRKVGKAWQGEHPTFQELSWITKPQ